jgi:hypothetical protein
MARLSVPPLALALTLAALAALGLAACGGGESPDLLPGSTASEINSNLDRVQELVSEGECIGAEDAAQEVSAQVDSLGGVDSKLKQALREGATRLNEVVIECEEATTEEEAPAIDEAEEPEAEEEKEKPQKPDKSKAEKEAGEAPEETTPTLPPQAKGEAKGHEKDEEAPPAEPGPGETASGGVGPATPTGGE